MRPVLLVHRRDCLQVGEDRVAVGARDLGVGRERHRRIDQAAVRESGRCAWSCRSRPRVHFPIPVSAIRRDVGRVECAERRRHRAPASEDAALRRGVAGNAIAGAGEIFAALRRCCRRQACLLLRLRGSTDESSESKRSQGAMIAKLIVVPLNSVRCRRRKAGQTCPSAPGGGFAGAGGSRARPRPP